MDVAKTAKLKICASMTIFGTIGLFVRNIPLPSSIIALFRGVIGVAFLLLVVFARRTPLSREDIRENLPWLCLSGAALGFNWILLFEAYRYTSVAVATLCYYMAPIFVILASPLLKERLTARKMLCVLAALAGMVCISGVLQEMPGREELRGILMGLMAAVLYASIVLVNKQIKGISAYDKTITQLGISAVVLAPYCLMTVEELSHLELSGRTLALLVLVGVLHTGVTYLLYFGSFEYVSSQTAAIISYIDPVVAVLASVLILREPMLPAEGVGALLILGAALASELPEKQKISGEVRQ